MIRIEHGYKAFGDQVIVEDLNLRIEHPGFYALLGPSGCGKSTLLNVIADSESLDQGSIEVFGTVVMIYQNYELIDTLDVYDNIFLGKDVKEEDLDLIRLMDVEDLLHRYPSELSGGQKQRVGILRAMVSCPDIICCDEPVESLDESNKKIVMDVLQAYSKEHIVLLVTHQLENLDHYCDAIMRFEDHHVRVLKWDVEERKAVKKTHAIPSLDVKRLLKKIVRKTNRSFLWMSCLLVLLLEGSFLLKEWMFAKPRTSQVVNADMVYVEGTADALAEEGIHGIPVLPVSNTMLIDGDDYVIFVSPYVESDRQFESVGKMPSELNVVVNQNVVNEVYGGSFKSEELVLPSFIGGQVYDIPFTIVGEVIEEDTKKMHIYYDLNGVYAYLETIELEDGGTALGYLKSFSNLQQLNVGYDNIETYIESHMNVHVKTTLYAERLLHVKEMQLYQILFTSFVWLFAGLLCVFVWLFTKKETDSYLKSFAILCGQNVPLHKLKTAYRRRATCWFSVWMLVHMGVVYWIGMRYEWAEVNFLLWVLGGIVILRYVVVILSMKDLKQEKISYLLKGMNEA